MDALKQDLICEFHAEDRVYDCTFLHDWDMFAAAQNKYLHIYDSQGTELHCMRTIRKPRFLEFLPYHYLLVSISDYGIIDYLDVSTGTSVASLHTSFGCPTSFAQNPHNAIIFQGTARGTVNMWSPNEKKALVTLFCHHGAVRYTNGQRKGLGLALGAPVYVCDKDMEKNTVTVGPESELFTTTLVAGDFNWISIPELTAPMRVKAKARYRQPEQPATVRPLPDGKVEVEFDEPQRAITRGQAVVLYDGDVVVGGGTIL